jgi:hypothetical protein
MCQLLGSIYSLEWLFGRLSVSRLEGLVCESCGSVYDFKWFASDQEMRHHSNDKAMTPGRLFNCYYAVQAELRRKVNAKQYVAILIWKTKTTNGKKYYPVYVAQVKNVYPALQPESFCPDDDAARVSSNFTIREDTKEIWFYAPVVDFDKEEMARSVIDNLVVKDAPSK